MTKNALLKRGPKNSGMGWPPPHIIRAMPERKRFFSSIDPFPKGGSSGGPFSCLVFFLPNFAWTKSGTFFSGFSFTPQCLWPLEVQPASNGGKEGDDSSGGREGEKGEGYCLITQSQATTLGWYFIETMKMSNCQKDLIDGVPSCAMCLFGSSAGHSLKCLI